MTSLALIEITGEPLDSQRALEFVADPGAGAVCLFLGVVRDNNLDRRVEKLHYEAYAQMAEQVMRALAGEAARTWPVCRIAMQHRTGTLAIGEPSVLVAVSAPHRPAAFEACRSLIDRLKLEVPVWKKEYFEGGAIWLEGLPEGVS